LWAEVLPVEQTERLAPTDHFFHRGGHSLLATQLISRISRAFGVELPLRRVFEAPRLEALAAVIDEARRQGEGLTAVPPLAPMAPTLREGAIPLSFSQTRLWFLNELQPGSPAYNIPGGVRLRGPLDARALERALMAVQQRHEALRTTFRADGQAPRQVISPVAQGSLAQIDLRGLASAAERTEALHWLARREALRPFDLAVGPLLRAILVALDKDDHVILLTLHHIIADGWSMGVFLRDLVAYYGTTDGEAASPPLPELTVQYADYAVWQRGWLTEALLTAEVEHWRRRLEGMPPSLDLPTDRPRPPVETARGASRPVLLPPPVSAAVAALARNGGATPFMVLLAAFQAVLGHWSGSDDIVVGSPIAGRSRHALEDLIGFFVNNLVLRGDLRGDPSFTMLLERVREVTLDAYAHQDVPFERLVEALEPRRDLSRAPLFQVMFILQNVPPSRFALPGLEVEPLTAESGTAKYDLTLSLEESEAGIRGSLEWNRDLFDPTTAARLVGHFEHLVSAVVAAPERPVGALAGPTPAQRHQLLHEWNSAPRPPAFAGSALSLSALFAAQAARTPDAVALRALDPEVPAWTYRQLRARGRHLAVRLVALGVGPEVRVGISAHRSPAMVVALLAVLEAGGAYVPLDPAYPEARLAFMLDDATVQVVVGHGELLAKLPVGERSTLLLDEVLAEASEAAPEAAPDAAATHPLPTAHPDHLAYVIYTSGSTGRPKGVAIEHRAAVALLAWARQVFDAEDLAGVLASTSINFDLSIFEIFLPLVTGGTVILARDALELRADSTGVRLLNTVPSAAAELLRQGALPPSVRTVNLAGEPLPESLAEALHGTGSVRRVFNLYGPSEDTTYSTHARVEAGSGKPRIGFPVAGTAAYILDRRGRPVGLGIAGELALGGAGVARGYLGRPARTAASFLPDPWSDRPGARLYRTGDQVSRRRDGHLDFLGRRDHQVKVRGFRIELGEIEAALLDREEVLEAVAMVRRDSLEDPRLVAYLVAASSNANGAARRDLDVGALRRALGERLPAYMIPSHFLILDALPRTPNGKLDRRALPVPGVETGGDADGATDGDGTRPRDPVEEILAGLWAEVLGRESVGVHTDFFALGGHSLLATQVVSRVREAFAVELPVRALFETPTVAALAATVKALRGGSTERAAPPLRAHPEAATAPLTFAQSRLWFLERLGVTGSTYNLPAAARLRGALRAELLERALGEIVRRHGVLRGRFDAVDGEPRQSVLEAIPLALPTVDLTLLPPSRREGEARRRAQAVAAEPFDLERGPLLRAALLRLAPDEHLLVLAMHHLVSDGWSLGVFLRELAALYRAFAEGQASPLPDLPIQYGDYAHWQRARFSETVLAAELDHWRQRLAGAPPALALPTDRPHPAVQTFAGAVHGFDLGETVGGDLAAWSRGRGATLFMTLLAAFDVLLARHGGQDDLVVGTPVAGREQRAVEGLIGFFVNTLALRIRLGDDPSFEQLIQRVRDVALDAFAHQEVPFERLLEELAPRRDLSRDPIFQVVFALQNTPRPVFELPGLEIHPLDTPSDTAKFDLTLFLEESAGGLRGGFEYRTDLFDATTVARLAARFRVLLADAVAHPERRLSQLALLSAAERHQVVREWSPGSDPAGSHDPALVPRRVAQWAVRQPMAPAVVGDGETLSYAALEARARLLAHRLGELGVGPEVPVGVCLERSPLEIVALLAVWRAGGAYLPLDPAYPAARRRFMLADAGAMVLLTTAALDEDPTAAAAQGDWTRIFLDEADPVPDPAAGDEHPSVEPHPDHLAYIIYTSGSTGRPKGVEIRHRTLARLVAWHQRAFGVTAEDRATHLAGLGFDASVWEIWPYLAAGAAVHLATDVQRADPQALRRWLVDQGITVAFVPTPLTEILLRAADGTDGTDGIDGWPPETALRFLLTGGDALQATPPPGLPFALINNYGPTENTVVATSGRVPTAPASGEHRAPSLGRPIDGVRMHLLDRHGHAVGLGVPGELVVGGGQLARGYRGRPSRTAGAFVPDPFASRPGARLYRTGDLARWRGDGDLDFLGRIDHQVKVRGVRIELGEIEVRLAAHPEVRDSVVLARDDVPGQEGERTLVAYVLGRGESGDGRRTNPDPDTLGDHLRAALPAAMVPAFFVILDAWPLTENGKVDRRRLPLPDADHRGGAASAAAVVAPRDPLELELVRIWETLLGRAPIGIDQDFFGLGGHSLAAVRLVARIRERFDRELPLTALFQGATVETLAAMLRRHAPVASRRVLVELRAEGVEPSTGPRPTPLFCIHPVGGNVLCYLELVRRLDGSGPVYGLQSPAPDAEGRRPDRVEALADCYLEAVRRRWPEGPYRLLGWSMGGLVAFEMARQLQAAGAAVEQLVLLDTAPPEIGATADGVEGPAALLGAFIHDLTALSGGNLAEAREGIESLGGDDPGAVFERLAAAGLLPPELGAERVRELFEVFAANVHALRRYTAEGPLYRGPLELFLAATPSMDRESAVAGWRRHVDQASEVGAGVTVTAIPGDHYGILRSPGVEALAARLRADGS
jgi:amino acid adenylation domain-containing protein